MAENSSIEWTHHTFNPWRGCSKVHAGCTNCYAEKNQGVAMQGITWGEVWQGGQRVVKAESGWKEPLRWARAAAFAGERYRVFCASLADVLEVPTSPPETGSSFEDEMRWGSVVDARERLDSARERLWSAIRSTEFVCSGCGDNAVWQPSADEPEACGHCSAPVGGLDWLLLTKRPENWRLVPVDVRSLTWLGTSISDQKTADEWVPPLLPAEGFRLRFLSVEPLVGPVDLWAFFKTRLRDESLAALKSPPMPGLDWVIVGGESGPKARPCQVEWVRDIVRQCREAGVPCFVKQLGSAYADARNGVAGARLKVPDEAAPLMSRRLADPKGGDMAEWPEDLRVRQFPEVRHG